MAINPTISVAVPTRHRSVKLKTFLDSFYSTTTPENRPQLIVIFDNPTQNDGSIKMLENATNEFGYPQVKYVINQFKSGMSKLWNQCIIESATDWVLICNDDGIFIDGWLEYLLEKIATGKYLQINIMHYGGFAVHKKLVLLNGWFDERFLYGALEDNDWQLRLMESELREQVIERPTDFVHMYHDKRHGEHSWVGSNLETMMAKWSRVADWKLPSFRRLPEINWHPYITALYEGKYKQLNRLGKINEGVNSDREIYHW